ncbi:hypothetical protein [Ulvibacterium sp.]|uniref:hypothetical protein n=1 Tax=Ulvibacterium sp. TaxID=2665914 RepID=UPI0026347BDC|nr:hypothetical protein [Ulvibacterium sp.]
MEERAIDLSTQEPITKLLVKKFKLSRIACFLILIGIYGLLSFLIAVFEGNFIPGKKGLSVSYVEDYSTFLDFLILNPLVVILIQKYLSKFSRVFHELNGKGIINVQTDGIRKEISTIKKYFGTPIPVLLSMLISILAMTFHTLNISRYDGYFIFHGENFMSITGIYVIVLTTLYVYFLIYSLQQVFFLIRLKRKVFSQNVKVELLHEDRCGGLKKVGDLCMTLNYALFLLAITLLLFLLADLNIFNDIFSFRVLFVMPIYLIGATFLFFYPLIPIHKKMEKERAIHLTVIGKGFDKIFDEYKNDTDLTQSRSHIENMKDLQEIFSWMEKIPKWPIDTKTYSKFMATILVPLIVFIFQILTNIENISTGIEILLE